METSPTLDVIRFGSFRLDTKTGELYRGEFKIRLQEQPFQILRMLLGHAGEVVSREEIRKALWSDDTIVEFDNSVHAAIKKLRVALGDSAENPTYIETLPRKGYRFIGTVEASALETKDPMLSVEPVALEPKASQNFEQGVSGVRPSELEYKEQRRPAWLIATVTMIVVLFAAGFMLWVNRRGTVDTAGSPLVVPLTTYPGWEGGSSFSPDGNQVVFVGTPVKDYNPDIYVKQLGSESPRRLTTDPRQDFSPAWSPDGQYIAFARSLGTPRSDALLAANQMAVMMVPINGGRERQVAELRTEKVPVGGRWFSWHSSGKWLAVPGDQELAGAPSAIYLLSTETGERRRLTSPPKGGGDTTPTFSSDGRSLVFVRRLAASSFDIFLLRLTQGLLPEGEPKQLTFGHRFTASPAWFPDGKEIIYSSGSHIHSTKLWRILTSGSGEPKPLPFSAQGTAVEPALSPDGRRLIYQDWFMDIGIWRHGIPNGKEEVPRPSKFMASNKVQESVQYSPDGGTVLFVSYASGNGEIWISDADGSNPLQLTHLGGPRPLSPSWSPDGRDIIFNLAAADGYTHLFVVPARGGPLRQLTRTSFNEGDPSYSSDGQWIYFTSDRSGASEIWKMPVKGGDATQMTRKGGSDPKESIDGEALFYSKQKEHDFAELWKIPTKGGDETLVLEEVYRSNFDLKQSGIYYVARPDRRQNQFLFYDFKTRKRKRIATLETNVYWGFTISPDENWILNTQYGGSGGSDLVLVENFR